MCRASFQKENWRVPSSEAIQDVTPESMIQPPDMERLFMVAISLDLSHIGAVEEDMVMG